MSTWYFIVGDVKQCNNITVIPSDKRVAALNVRNLVIFFLILVEFQRNPDYDTFMRYTLPLILTLNQY